MHPTTVPAATATAQPSVPLRPLGVTEALDAAVRIVRRNGRAAYAIAVPLAAVQAIVQLAIVLGSAGTATPFTPTAYVAPEVLGTVFAGLFAPVVAADVLGGRVGAGRAVRSCGARGLRLVVLGLIIAVCEDVGLVLLLVGGAWLWGIWAVAAPTFTLERRSLIGSLRRSFRLTRAHFWRTWGTRALAHAIVLMINAIITLPVTLLALDLVPANPDGTRPLLYAVVVTVGGLVVTALTSPVLAAVDNVIYSELRMRTEGLDLHILLDRRLAATPAPDRVAPAW